jgi:ferric-dicitrate binding protein FerR (iron transport regulator)
MRRKQSRRHAQRRKLGIPMNATSRLVISLLLAASAGLLSTEDSRAQNRAGCTLQQIGGTARHLVNCRGGLSIIAEPGARYTLLDRNRDGEVDAVRLTEKAILLETPRAPRSTGFEVKTPQAIAAVRGTQWAVDVGQGRTSVFVVQGSVDVRRPSGAARATLTMGEGVDVEADSGPLTVKRWPARRVSALMARFGR